MKKIISLLILSFFLFSSSFPVFASIIIGGSNGHYQFSLSNTLYNIPTDGRNLRDFVFTDADFDYKHYADPEENYYFTGAKITTKMTLLSNYNKINVSEDSGFIMGDFFAPFFIIVDPFYWSDDPNKKFGIPFYKKNGIGYAYLVYRQDENQNYCLFLHLPENSDGTTRPEILQKLNYTCSTEFLTRDPFFLFMQLRYNRFGRMNSYSEHYSFKNIDRDNGHFSLYYTTNYSPEEGVISFTPLTSVSFSYQRLFSNISSDYFRPLMDTAYNFSGITLFQTTSSFNFLKQGTGPMFRTYSYNFNDFFYSEYQKDTSKKYIAFPGSATNFMDVFVETVAKQYYGSPTYTANHTYIGTGGLFSPSEYDFSDCEGFSIGCYLNGIGKLIGKGFSGFFSIFSGFGDFIYDSLIKFFKTIVDISYNFLKDIFGSLTNNEFYKNYVKQVVDYLFSFFEVLFKLVTFQYNWDDIRWGDQEYICSKNLTFLDESSTAPGKKPIEALGALIYLLSPYPPDEGQIICTSLGLKEINYNESTFVDLLLFNIFIFASVWFAFIGLRKYH